MATTPARRNKKRYGIRLPGNNVVVFSGYGDIYSSLNSLLGLTDLDTAPATGTRINAPVSSVPGIARIRVRYGGTANTKPKIGTVICAPNFVEDALSANGGLTTKQYGQDIQKAYLPRRRVFVA